MCDWAFSIKREISKSGYLAGTGKKKLFHKRQTGQMELSVMQLREGSKKKNYFLDSGKRKKQQSVQYSVCSWHSWVSQQFRETFEQAERDWRQAEGNASIFWKERKTRCGFKVPSLWCCQLCLSLWFWNTLNCFNIKVLEIISLILFSKEKKAK